VKAKRKEKKIRSKKSAAPYCKRNYYGNKGDLPVVYYGIKDISKLPELKDKIFSFHMAYPVKIFYEFMIEQAEKRNQGYFFPESHEKYKEKH
jgi:hypothetical protein